LDPRQIEMLDTDTRINVDVQATIYSIHHVNLYPKPQKACETYI